MEQRVMTRPQPGYWRLRQASRAPWSAASIQYEQTEYEPGEPLNRMDRGAVLTARLNGEIVAIDAVWLRRGEEITKAEHDFLVADRKWAKDYAPDDPAAQPRKRVDLANAAPVYQRR